MNISLRMFKPAVTMTAMGGTRSTIFCNFFGPFAAAICAVSTSVPANAQIVINGSTQLDVNASDSIYDDIFAYDTGSIYVHAARPFPRADLFDRSELWISAADGITDGMIVSLADNSRLTFHTTNAMTGGDVWLSGAAQLDLVRANAITGGEITLSGTVVLDASIPFAVTGGTVTAKGNSRINVKATNAFTRGVDLNVYDDAVLDIRGHTLTVGSLNATGAITNTSANASTLIIDSTQSPNSISHIWGRRSNGAGGLSLVKKGRGEVVLHGWQDYTGHTTVNGGLLSLDEAYNLGPITVTNGGTLGMMSSDAGDTVVDAGGTLLLKAPGWWKRPNTINNLTLKRGSVLDVRMYATAQVAGIADLQGPTVRIGYSNNFQFQPNVPYPVISAGQVSGWVANVVDELTFLDLRGDTTATQFTVTAVRNNVSFAQVGATPNQDAAAVSAEALRAGHALHDAIINQEEAGARAAFDALSGESHASAATASIEDSRFVRNAAMDRVRTALDGRGQGHASSSQPAGWGQAFGSWGDSDDKRHCTNVSRRTTGVVTGIDGLVLDTWRVGAMTGYGRSDFNVKKRNASGTSDNVHFGLYGGTQWGPLGLRGGAAYAWHDIETERSVVFPGFSESLKSDQDSRSTQIFGEVDYRFDGIVSLAPFAGLAHVSFDQDGFRERGGTSALIGRSSGTDVTFSTLGVRADYGLTLGAFNARAHGLLGWRHAFGDTTPVSINAFAGGSAFAVDGVPIADHVAVLEAGLDMSVADDIELSLLYAGQLADSASDHGVKATLDVRF